MKKPSLRNWKDWAFREAPSPEAVAAAVSHAVAVFSSDTTTCSKEQPWPTPRSFSALARTVSKEQPK